MKIKMATSQVGRERGTHFYFSFIFLKERKKSRILCVEEAKAMAIASQFTDSEKCAAFNHDEEINFVGFRLARISNLYLMHCF